MALLEAYDFDPDLAAAHRLGRDIAGVLGVGASRLLPVLDDDSRARLVADMPATVIDMAGVLHAVRTELQEGQAATRDGVGTVPPSTST